MNPDFKDIINSIGELQKLQQQAIDTNMPYFTSEVNTIIDNNIKDENRIFHLLDALLDLASNDDVLVLYKKLCRHLYFINQRAAFEYINGYREQWDTESLENNQE